MTMQSHAATRQSAEDLILISVDDHICEPADMFTRQVPARWRDQAPRVVEEPNGSQQWYYGDVRGRNLGLNAVAGKPREYFNIDASRYDQMRPGCFDVHQRVRDMSAGGQLAGLNFPNFTGFSGQVLNQGPDRDLNLIMIQAYNDWHVDEWCARLPGTLHPLRHPAAVRRPARGRGAAPARGQGLPRGDLLGEPRGAGHAVDPHPALGSAV